MIGLRLVLIAVATISAGLPAARVAAAPQALALVAPPEAVDFACGPQGCVLHLPTLCLQSYRDPPHYGAPYEIAAGGAVLIVELQTGDRLELPAVGRITIAANENFSSVSLRLDAGAMAELDARRVSLVVAPGTILLPVAEAGDPAPQDAEEIAVATGPSRAAALRFLERRATRVAAAQLLSRGITLLPEFGQRTDYDAHAVWTEVLGEAAAAGAPAAAIDLAGDSTSVCSMDVLRRCLEMRQRELLRELNDRLWDELGGS